MFIKPRAADFVTAPFTGAGGVVPQYVSPAQDALNPSPLFNGDRTGVTFEGPFLRYTVTKPPFGMWQGLHNDSVMTFYFDLYSARVVFLPFMGSIEVIGQYPGTWDFEVQLMPVEGAMPDPRMAALPTALDGDATLSLRIAGDAAQTSFRIFGAVPPGAHSFSVNASNLGVAGVYPITEVIQETLPVRGAAGPAPAFPIIATGVDLVQHGGVTSAFMNRVGQHNAGGGAKVSLGSGASGIGAAGFVQWHLGWT